VADRNDMQVHHQPEEFARKVEFLAEEVKLLAINLAVTLAKAQNRSRALKDMEPQFTDLIRRANDTSRQVADVLQAFRSRTRGQYGLPASSEIVEKRGAYDAIEARLNYVYDLSRDIINQITDLKRQEQVG
jgi:hypothetical protein